jgi:hypothetical protein
MAHRVMLISKCFNKQDHSFIKEMLSINDSGPSLDCRSPIAIKYKYDIGRQLCEPQ